MRNCRDSPVVEQGSGKAMIRINAYEYILQERIRQNVHKPKKKRAYGFDELLKAETIRLERRKPMENEKTVTLQLTIPEIVMLQECVNPDQACFAYDWQRMIAENLERKAKEAYEKPSMSQWDYEKKIQEEYDKWPEKSTAEFMSAAEAARLRFFSKVEEEHVEV